MCEEVGCLFCLFLLHLEMNFRNELDFRRRKSMQKDCYSALRPAYCLVEVLLQKGRALHNSLQADAVSI